jgi:NADH-quinone oxidoreductase subunit E
VSNHKIRKVAGILNSNGKNGSLINVLEDIQAEYRYLPEEALVLVSDRMGVPLSQVYSVATFYHAFSLKPSGEHSICVCTGTACHVRGAVQVLNRLESTLGIEAGDTSRDRMFTLETGNCLGACAIGPVVVVDGEYEGNMTTKKVDKLLKRAISLPRMKQ